jgi:hypothetical protein
VLAVAAYASISYPAYHFVMLAHLHNLVPLVFLWTGPPGFGGRDRPRRPAWIAGLVAGGFLAMLFVSDYFAGRALYGALATFRAYLEFPGAGCAADWS